MADRNIIRSIMTAVKPPDMDMYSYITQSFHKNPSKEALVDIHTGQSFTFAEFATITDTIARHLMSFGFGPGSTLVIYSSNNVEYAFMAVAALRLGGMFAGVNCLSTASDLHRLLHLCGGTFLFASNEIAGSAIKAARDTKAKVIFVTGEHQGCVSYSTLATPARGLPKLPSVASLRINTDDVCCILFSSGTTGLPKAVMLSHKNLIYANAVVTTPSTNILRERNLVFVPLSHIFGIAMTLYGLACNTTSLLMKTFDPVLYLETIQKYRLSIIHVVPPIAVLLAKSPLTERYDLTCVEGVMCAAAPLSGTVEKELLAKLKGKNTKVLQIYGLTETTGGATASFVDDNLRMQANVPLTPAGSCGLLLPFFESKVVDLKTGESLVPNKDGELLFRGPQIMKGYQKNEEATRNCIDNDGWLHSGDIGHVDENGYIFVVDRLKELIKYKGFQVPPAELEELLLSHPNIDDCGVIGLPDEAAGELPHAWVVVKPSAKLTESEVIKFVDENVASYKKLRGGVTFVDAIPKSPSGKILRRQIKEQNLSKKSKL